MSRRESREKAVKLLYEYTFHNGMNPKEFLQSRDCDEKHPVTDFTKETFIGITVAQGEIDKFITDYSNGWKITRISKVTLAILRLAMYEIIFTETSSNVVINEALEIAKKYDDKKSVAFINGILHNFAKSRKALPSDEKPKDEE